MGPHRRRVDKQSPRLGKNFAPQMLPQALPDPTLFPPPETHVNRVPVSKLGRQVPPRTARAIQVEDRFNKFPLCRITGCTRQGVLGCFHRWSQFLPDRIADNFARFDFAHP
jgi:hypothetical protein